MAKASKKAASILVSDDVTIAPIQAKPVATNAAPTMIELAINDGKNREAIVARIKAHGARDKVNDAARDDYYVGRIMTACGVEATMARKIIGLKPFNRLPNAKNTDANRTLLWDRAYGSARTDWSRLMDKAFPKVSATPSADDKAERAAKRLQEARELVAKADKVEGKKDAPITVASLVIGKATTIQEINEHCSALVSHLRMYHKTNAKAFIGEEGSAWREWLLSAPSK